MRFTRGLQSYTHTTPRITLIFGTTSRTAYGQSLHLALPPGRARRDRNFANVIEFPAGSTILLPSVAIAHSNTPIGPGERRCLFTQYTFGGLFRWAARGTYVALVSIYTCFEYSARFILYIYVCEQTPVHLEEM